MCAYNSNKKHIQINTTDYYCIIIINYIENQKYIYVAKIT